MIVPDTIDPYVGYKALRIDHQGLLASPTYRVGWPAGERMEATCPMQGWNWTLVEGTPPTPFYFGPHRGISYQHGYDPRYYQTTGFITSHTSPNQFAVGPKPDYEPPEGFYWDYQLLSHTPAEKNCSCGIYAVDTVQQTAGYLDAFCVICEITMWGQVTLGEMGARGQYAYPTKLYVPDHLKEKALTVAASYEIEAVPQTFEVGKRGMFVSQPLRDDKADARTAALAFSGMAAVSMTISSLLNLLTDWRIAPTIFLILAIGFFALFLLATYDSRKTTA